MHATVTHIENPGPLALPKSLSNLFMGLTVLGALAFLGGLAVDSTRAWQNYMQTLYIFTGFSLGGMVFVAINHAVASHWAVVPRRLAEAFMSFIPVAALLFIVLLVGISMEGGKLYSWLGHEHGIASPTKQRWLSFDLFAARNVLFFVIWFFVARKLVAYSVAQDGGQNQDLSLKAARFSIIGLLLFAPTFGFFSYDLLMSLEPKWFSTMFTVYTFAGVIQSTMALMVIIFVSLKRDQLKHVATPSHLKDLSGLLFAFTIFMTYIGFSQFMLIWYANLPEETYYYLKRSDHGWLAIAVLTWFFKFILPFFGLISQWQKKHEKWLVMVCWGVLVGQFLDIFWLSMPSNHPELVMIGWMEIGILAMFAGLFGIVVSRWMSKHSLIPVGDPRVLASVNWRFWE